MFAVSSAVPPHFAQRTQHGQARPVLPSLDALVHVCIPSPAVMVGSSAHRAVALRLLSTLVAAIAVDAAASGTRKLLQSSTTIRGELCAVAPQGCQGLDHALVASLPFGPLNPPALPTRRQGHRGPPGVCGWRFREVSIEFQASQASSRHVSWQILAGSAAPQPPLGARAPSTPDTTSATLSRQPLQVPRPAHRQRSERAAGQCGGGRRLDGTDGGGER